MHVLIRYTRLLKEQAFEIENTTLKIKIKELEQTLHEKECEIRELKQQITHYSQAYRNICAFSTYREKE